MAKGIVLTPQVTDPIAALGGTARGLWINTTGDLMHTKGIDPPENVSSFISNGVVTISDVIQNLSGTMIPQYYPVAISTLGGIELMDVATEANARAVVGLTSVAINSGNSGAVIIGGVIYNFPTAFNYRDIVYVSKTGGLTNVAPSIGVGGFVDLDFSIRVGVIKKNLLNPLNKDLVLNIEVLGQL